MLLAVDAGHQTLIVTGAIAVGLLLLAGYLILSQRRGRPARFADEAPFYARQRRRRLVGSVLMAVVGVALFLAANLVGPDQPRLFALAWGIVLALVLAMAVVAVADALAIRRFAARTPTIVKHTTQNSALSPTSGGLTATARPA